jgi:hypothetical protein
VAQRESYYGGNRRYHDLPRQPADKLNIDPLAAAHDKVEQNGIKYSAEKVVGKALKYNEYE